MKKTTPKVSASKSPKETLVALVLDKSGSMSSIAQATISGFNEYIGNLKEDKLSKYRVSLTLFDTVFEERYSNVKLSEVEDLNSKTYVPSGMTALYDAAMATILEAEKSTSGSQKVLCVIMTDGAENSSKEYTDKDLKKKIGELEKKGNWTFVFLGANQDSWLVGQKFGLSAQNVANYNATEKGTSAAFVTMAANTRSYSGASSLNTAAFFSTADQKNLGDTK